MVHQREFNAQSVENELELFPDSMYFEWKSAPERFVSKLYYMHIPRQVIWSFVSGIAFVEMNKAIAQKAEAEKAVQARIDRLFSIQGKEPVDVIHKKLGNIMWEYVGMARNEAGLKKAIEEIRKLKEYFYSNVRVTGSQYEFNQELEKALRLEDFFEIGELMARDALNRNESCGGHFREESQTEEGEAKRDDANYMYVAAWEYKGEGKDPELHKEPLKYEFIEVKTRNYKD
jgi:succinate dehydrogenase / fumarate reductase flavoprotein subunit